MNHSKTFPRVILEIPYHIIFISILPLVILISKNISEIELNTAFRALFVSFGIGLLIYIIVRFLINEKYRERLAIILSLSIISFLSYGHFYDTLRLYLPLVRHRILLPVIVILTICMAFLLWRKFTQSAISEINRAINIISFVLLLFNITVIVSFFIREKTINQSNNFQHQQAVSSQTRPDIYYIVLDSYTRGDILKSYFDFDNSKFLNELQNMGFYVANCAESNYNFTLGSISTTLNMDYLSSFDIPAPADHQNTQPYINHLQDNLVMKSLQEKGYQIVSFENEFPWLEWKNADIYIRPPAENVLTNNLHPFELLYIQGTMLRYFADFDTSTDIVSNKMTKYNLAKFQLEQLGKINNKPSPKFVLIDLEVSHGPFVFNSDGTLNKDSGKKASYNPSNLAEFKRGYIQSIEFLNKEMVNIVHNILIGSDTPPVIILQADHGFRSGDSFNKIFSAYYLPGGEQLLYPTISPVNNFRLINSLVFKENTPLLPDRFYQKIQDDFYKFNEVFESNPVCK